MALVFRCDICKNFSKHHTASFMLINKKNGEVESEDECCDKCAEKIEKLIDSMVIQKD